MKLSEKQELVRLLTLYQADLLKANEKNIQEAAKHKGKRWEGDYTFGVKAQCSSSAPIVCTQRSTRLFCVAMGQLRLRFSTLA